MLGVLFSSRQALTLEAATVESTQQPWPGFPILGCCDVEQVQVRSEGNDKVVGKSRAKYSVFSLQNFA